MPHQNVTKHEIDVIEDWYAGEQNSIHTRLMKIAGLGAGIFLAGVISSWLSTANLESKIKGGIEASTQIKTEPSLNFYDIVGRIISTAGLGVIAYSLLSTNFKLDKHSDEYVRSIEKSLKTYFKNM